MKAPTRKDIGWAIALIIGAVLTALIFFTVIDAKIDEYKADQELVRQRNRASRRVDLLNQRIDQLSDQVAENNELIGRLSQQVTDLGGQPATKESSSSSNDRNDSSSNRPRQNEPDNPSPPTTQPRTCLPLNIVCV